MKKYKEIITKVEAINPQPKDVIVLSYKTNSVTLDELESVHNFIKNTFSNNQVISIPDSNSIELTDKEQLIGLKNVIDKILIELEN